MCRWVDDEQQGLGFGAVRGRQRDALRIRSFQLHLSFFDADEATSVRLPETLTLLYLPRANGADLEINEAKINPNSPALVALHRLRLRRPEPVAVFATTDRVRTGPGVGFQVLLRDDDALLNGVFRRRAGSGEWRVDCRCAVEEGAFRVSAAEVRIVEERVGEMREKVKMVAPRRQRRHRRLCELEEIPEETDVCDCGKVLLMDGGDDEGESMGEMDGWDVMGTMEMDTVRWAVDLGIWALCLGVGVLFTRASLRRRKRLFI